MYIKYPACFYKEENGYSVIFPDLNYLSTCGETLEEAESMASDCLFGYLSWCVEDGDVLPAPTPENEVDCVAVANKIDATSAIGEAFVKMIPAPIFINFPPCPNTYKQNYPNFSISSM